MARAQRAVLVTGGAGYVGAQTCKALAQCGYLPLTFDNLTHGHARAVKWGPLVQGDLADTDLLAHTLGTYSIDAVLHFAAYACPAESMREPAKYFRNNVCNTLTLLECMVKAGIRNIVFSSTCATYGIPARLPVSEKAPQLPISPYGESKLSAERILHWWGRAYGVRSVILRYFNAAGADPDGEIGEAHEPETHLIPNAIAAAHGSHAALNVFGSNYPTRDGTALRDYVHVCDLAAAHLAALDHLDKGGRSIALNLGAGAGHTVRDVVNMVEAVGGRPVPVHIAPRRMGDPPELTAHVGLASDVLGWEPRHSSLRTIVESAWRWHLERPPEQRLVESGDGSQHISRTHDAERSTSLHDDSSQISTAEPQRSLAADDLGPAGAGTSRRAALKPAQAVTTPLRASSDGDTCDRAASRET